MSTRWYYAKAGTTERQGPVTVEQIQQKVAAGELGADDIAWRSGMPQWAPIGHLPELASGRAPAPVPPRLPPMAQVVPSPKAVPPAQAAVPTAVPVASYAELARATGATPKAEAASPQSVGYFTPGGDMPMRARANLAGYAQGTGPVGEWPLSDDHVLQLAGAVKWRKRILAAAGLTKFFYILYLLLAIVMVLVTIFTAATSKNYNRDLVPVAGVTVFAVPFAVLFGLAQRAIRFCRVWGSLVMGTLTTLGILVQFGAFLVTQSAAPSGMSSRTGGPEVFAMALYLAIAIAIAAVYWRAFSANSKYLNSPLWCQEALAVAEKAK